MLKEQLFRILTDMLDLRIMQIRKDIELAKESRDNETKSSVGDKYETGRTLMQQEVEKSRILLKKAEYTKAELSKIDLNHKFDTVEYGSLVKTELHNYFISAAFGKIECNGENYYCISLASPVGKALQGKKAGDQIIFMEKKVPIIAIS